MNIRISFSKVFNGNIRTRQSLGQNLFLLFCCPTLITSRCIRAITSMISKRQFQILDLSSVKGAYCLITSRLLSSILCSQWVVPSLQEQDTGVASGYIWQRSGNILYHPKMGLIQKWNKTPPASGMLFYQITSNWPLLPIKANGHTN